jgi:hypothetical protein
VSTLPQQVHVDGSVKVATWRNVLLTAWTGPIEYGSVRAVYDHGAALAAARGGGKIAYLSAVVGQLPMPGDTARLDAAKLWKKSDTHMCCGAIVITAEGFWAGAARAALTGIMVLASPGYPTKVFSKPEDATAFLSPFIEGRPSATQLLLAYRDHVG